MTEIETFNENIKDYIWRALLNPDRTSIIIKEVETYTTDVIKDLLAKNIDNASKIKILYDFRDIFNKVINLDIIAYYNSKFIIQRFLFNRKLKKVTNPFNLGTFIELINNNESCTWKSMYNKFTPDHEGLKKAKLEKISNLNERRANLIKLNLNLNDFQKFLSILYNQKDKNIYISLVLVMLSCGRRPKEIFNKDTVFRENEEKLEIIGLAKKRDTTQKDSVIINTFLPPKEIIKLRNSLLIRIPNYKSSTNVVNANKLFKNHIAKVFNISLKEIYNCRSLFAVYSYEKWGENNEKNYFISQILGHEDEDLETAFSYNKFIISNESSYNLEDFKIEESTKKRNNLEGKKVLREKLEKIKNNSDSKRTYKLISELLLTLFPSSNEIIYNKGLNVRIRENSKKILGISIDNRYIKEALEFIFLY